MHLIQQDAAVPTIILATCLSFDRHGATRRGSSRCACLCTEPDWSGVRLLEALKRQDLVYQGGREDYGECGEDLCGTVTRAGHHAVKVQIHLHAGHMDGRCCRCPTLPGH